MTRSKFRFKRLDRIGVPDAGEDREFLEHCFVDTEDVEALLDCGDSRRVVVGGTGCGKTALLDRLSRTHVRVLTIAPESLALAHITNSTILKYLLSLGVKLDIFFKLLWRHVFTVEILRSHFGVYSEADQVSFLQKVRTLFDVKHRRAVKYLEEWGRTFWKETDYRIKELTTKLEREISGSINSKVPGVSFTASDAHKLTQQQIQEVVERAQVVVNQVQIRELSEVLEMLDAVLDDPQKPYYVLIDRLDENWIEDRFRYLLVRALLETVRDFRKVRNAKIVVALRRDLIDRVFKLTRDAGFQQEKYESIYLRLDWSERELVELLRARLGYLLKKRGVRDVPDVSDLLPKYIDQLPALEYIVSRTLRRPRDAIQFMNCCIEQAIDRSAISVDNVRQAEGVYSPARLRAIADEWAADYPTLLRHIGILKNRQALFPLEEISDSDVAESCLRFAISDEASPPCPLGAAALATANGLVSPSVFRAMALDVFYRTGIIGLKLEKHEGIEWAYAGHKSISSAEQELPGVRVAIHQGFWRTLGVRLHS
ncbi:P-loop ATPase, Sll1717 family [Anaeromyxobacter oryzisoli]|uniref:P-loop ATPase, Sll1717 family n=1 Tax=Anaeromyxobacter oryzisoli TaxID=2925408 RepID=UPI001F59CAC9|nr:hypothetical protein [Anaeromyxobacter sp. SG63]